MPALQNANTIIAASLMETGTISPGEVPEPALINWVLDKLNRLIDSWGAKRLMVWAMQFQEYTLVPNLQPHTIGVSQTSGPVTAISAAGGIVTLTFSSNNLFPGTVVTLQGFTVNVALNLRQVTLITSTPTSATFSYSPSITNGAETGLCAIIGADLAAAIPTFNVKGNRPTRIEAANLIVNTVNPAYNIPINIRDADWWASQRVQTLTSSYPTDVYYQADWPNGSLYIWPIPTTNYPIQLEWWTQIVQFNLQDTFTMPPGYWDAVVLSLAESLLSSLPPDDPQQVAILKDAAARARDTIMVNNEHAPRISTGGDGLPSGGNARPSFDWRTGFNVGTWSGSGR